MRKISILVLFSLLLSSCAPVEIHPTSTFAPTATTNLIPPVTATVTETPFPTFTPTATISPDLNRYECAENVSQADCDFIKEGVRLTRYYLINYLGSDILQGVKFTIINDAKDTHVAEGGSAGTFQVPKNGEPYVWINTGIPVWTEYSAPEYQYKHLGLIAHEFTHAWQWQHGCVSDNLRKQASGFLIEGYAGYIGYSVAGLDTENDAFSDALALSFWQASSWKEKDWFDNSDVNLVLIRHLVDNYGLNAYTQFCEAVGAGTNSDDAFKDAYGISIADFRSKMKTDILGDLASCTAATCGLGVDNYSDKYKLGHLIDRTKTTPNLIVHFVDQNNQPVKMTHVSMLKQNVGTTGEYVQPFVIPSIFSKAMLPGRYSFFFCEPGYPTDFSDSDCHYFETDWFDVFENQVTELTFQIPPFIENPNLPAPDLIVKFFDKDGNPTANLDLVICSYENPVRACSPYYEPARHTDKTGIYSDSLRKGKYLIKIFSSPNSAFTTFYQISDINISSDGATELEYHFPAPNLTIKFLDVNGSPIPDHGFVLCKLVNGVGDCNSPIYNQGAWGGANKNGVFEAKVDPGEYYVLTCKIECSGYPFDFTFEHIIVTEGQVTTVELPLSKKP